nr:DUF397 domain-containing protein [Streptomyces sp. NBC_00995]
MNGRASMQGVSSLVWFKSSYSSNGNEGDCVEIAAAFDAVHVRDSKNLFGPQLTFGEDAWVGFVAHSFAD